MKTVTGRVAVVSGAASGIGRATADRLAAAGAKVVMADVEASALATAVDEVRATGGEAIGVRTDVCRVEDIETLAQRTLDEYGAVHILCNIAGVEGGAPFGELSRRTWEWVMGVNFWGTLDACRVFLPHLIAQDEAHIVNCASMAGFATGLPTFHPYVSSKFAVVGMTENLEVELRTTTAPHVGVSLLSPGLVKTNMNKSERNRPTDVPATDTQDLRRKVHATIDEQTEKFGVTPEHVADLVLEGITENRFHILTHPEQTIAAFRSRLAWMESGTPPRSPADAPDVGAPAST
ncbi:SDR family NAD(P)-dependent oxidoreductase [Rhodococcus sp. BP-316]|uniref:SDR family NAD(P)-dependent oxidoreductase n=1 Tax=Rhodococcus sp. BP-316 TaxID=2739445 RepID=UPI001C9B9F38|nr:SDR family NAD(P)-dependent oxidoreductase [Rhodococcus sp. BP-316]MBY6683087.1 SDR family NAD(P)-dependent oxidoreductase [Rhodococcus sp. BP-316]